MVTLTLEPDMKIETIYSTVTINIAILCQYSPTKQMEVPGEKHLLVYKSVSVKEFSELKINDRYNMIQLKYMDHHILNDIQLGSLTKSVEPNMETNEVYRVCPRMLNHMDYMITRTLKEFFEITRTPLHR